MTKASPKRKPQALVADDDPVLRGLLARALAGLGFEVRTAASVDEALTQARDEAPDLAVLDVRMPGGGLETVAPLAARGACVVLLTGYGSIPLAVEAMKHGAADVLTKPCEPEKIMATYEKWRDTAPHPLLSPSGQPAGQRPTGTHDAQSHATAPSLPEVEWNHLQRILADCGGNISAAARRLNMHRKSLQRKLKKRPPASN